MITIWYKNHGHRPSKSEIIREDANKADILPSSFEVVAVEYGRRIDEETVDSNQFALQVNPPSDNISTDAIDSIATAFEDNWGGTVEHIATVQ